MQSSKFTTVISLLVAISVMIAGEAASAEQGLRLEKAGTGQVYFSYHGKPLLSFGGMSDFIFYAADDAYDYKQWADWQSKHGMNHCRAYLPGSWVHVEKFAEENGGAVENVLFPYQETEPGSRQFDLTQFDERYWKRFREQCQYLESQGIIIDLLMFKGWQLWNYNAEVARHNWDGHFFNPENNINDFTDHLDFEGHFFISTIGQNLVLSSAKEVIAYVSSPTGIESFAYTPRGAQIRLADLPLKDGEYIAHFFNPKTGRAGSRTVRVRSGTVNFRTPNFVDDYVVHIRHQ